jgi:hypothetical protein
MTPEDVPQPRVRPPLRVNTEFPHRPTRWTMQYFPDDEDATDWLRECDIVHNTDLWAPNDLNEWPPDSIFDMIYGYVVLKRWGDEKVIKGLLETDSDVENEENPPPTPSANEIPIDEWEDGPESGSMIKMADVLATIWQNSGLQKEQSPTSQQTERTQEVQERVLDWLGA